MGFELIPLWGFSATMIVSVALNALAGVVLLMTSSTAHARADHAEEDVIASTAPEPHETDQISRVELLMFSLGFCSLGYQMVLYRLFALEMEPLPDIFALVLTGFLLCWSIGAGLSSTRFRVTVRLAIGLLALWMLVPLATFYAWVSLTTGMVASDSALKPLVVLGGVGLGLLLCFTPCFFFGFLFARVTAAAAVRWGHDVGRLSAWNTAGSCLGVLLVTLVGFEMHLVVLVAVLALAISAAGGYSLEPSGDVASKPGGFVGKWQYALSGLAVLLVIGFGFDLSTALTSRRLRMFFSRAGVVGVDSSGNLNWDGLWHSKLSDGRDHIGTNNWRLATSPVLVHPTGQIRHACVIGLGSGITTTTLAMLESVESVDTYEINRGLAGALADYHAGTLGVLTNPKVNIIWQDARTGLALGDKKYDVIVTQPLYLKQSGSSLLNSREFLELVSSRLETGGVFCLYSNGTEAQQRSVRETATGVFAFGETFYDGYLLVLSQERLTVELDLLANRFQQFHDDPLWKEISNFDLTRDAKAVRARLDRPRLSWSAHGLVVTDDHPVIEYPRKLEAMLADQRP